jgi:hypothetical protein
MVNNLRAIFLANAALFSDTFQWAQLTKARCGRFTTHDSRKSELKEFSSTSCPFECCEKTATTNRFLSAHKSKPFTCCMKLAVSFILLPSPWIFVWRDPGNGRDSSIYGQNTIYNLIDNLETTMSVVSRVFVVWQGQILQTTTKLDVRSIPPRHDKRDAALKVIAPTEMSWKTLPPHPLISSSSLIIQISN